MFAQLSKIFPFSEVARTPRGRNALTKALSLCFLNGGLPQGTPISPMLTNLMMIPFDHAIAGQLWKDGFVYTRYADDITISHKYGFDYQEICAKIRAELMQQKAPFELKSKRRITALPLATTGISA